MTFRDDRVTIRQYLGHADQAAALVRELEAAGDTADEKTALALSFAVFRAASSARNLSLRVRESRPDLPWGELIAERELIVAEGLHVDPERLARVVRELVLPAASKLRAESAALEAASEGSSDVPPPQVGVQIPIDRARLEAFCEAHDITRFALFGSVLRADFTADSDVDVIVEHLPGRAPATLFGFANLKRELSELVQRDVDLLTPATIDAHARESIWAGAEVIYSVEDEEENDD